MVAWARSRTSTSSGSTSRIPRGGVVSSLGSRATAGGRSLTNRCSPAGRACRRRPAGSRASAPGPTRGSGRSGALLLGQRHDQLRFTRYLEEVLVADDRGDQRRLATVLTGNAADRADHAVEARVHLLKPQPGRSAKDDTDQPAGVDLVLRHDDLLDAVPVEINGEWSGLELEEVTAAATLDVPDHLDLLAATPDDGPGTIELFGPDGDAQPVLLVDEGQGPAGLAVHVGERRPGGAEGCGHRDRLHLHQRAVLDDHLVGLALREEGLLPEALRPQGLLHTATLLVDGHENGFDVLDEHLRFALRHTQDEGVHAGAGVVAVGDDLQPAAPGEIRELNREDPDLTGSGRLEVV